MPCASKAVDVVIELSQVTKTYRLFSSVFDQAIDVLGIGRLLPRRANSAVFKALDGIDLSISTGEQVGIVGRNGAGKTTLLKLLTGNFSPSSGSLVVRGQVQALMSTGLGFYPDFSGLDNLRAGLQYNGLTGREFDVALQDAIAFAELGQFLHQPTKTYSLGMRSRLQFAAATAIKPEVLIVDEVLGAGDAYFSGKSASRMKALTSNGCTLLLVSHSMQQVLQFCKRCVWLESGKIVMDGAALDVVRAYEEFSRRLEHEAALERERGGSVSVLADKALRDELVRAVRERSARTSNAAPELDATDVSRWPSDFAGPRIAAVRLLGENGTPTRTVRVGERAAFECDIVAQAEAAGLCRYVIVIYREDGQLATRLVSEELPFPEKTGQRLVVRVDLPQVLLGGGRYSASAAIYERLDLDASHEARTYDLLSRGFNFTVVAAHHDDTSLLHHPQQWSVDNGIGHADLP